MDLGRVIITSIIWIGCLSIAITTLITGSNMIGVIFPLLMAVGGTATIWGSASSKSERRQALTRDQQDNFYKAKREDAYEQKMRLLMEMMDDDEREAFKQALKRQLLNQDSKRGHLVDGELPFDADEYDYFESDERQKR